MKCFVTGATGYVGNFLIEKLKQSYDVTILVRNQKDYETYQNRGYKCILADLRNPETIKGAFDGIDYVFHLGNIASWWLKRDRDYFDVNVTGTYNLLKELENTKVKKIIHISSVAAIRQSPGKTADETTNHCGSFESKYSKSKYLTELEVNKFTKKGLPIVVLNPGVITGPKDLKTFGKTVIGIANKKIKSKFCPESYIPLGHVDDVIDLTIKAIDKPAGSKYVIVGENIKIKDVFDLVCDIKGLPKINKITPIWNLYLISFLSHLISFFTGSRPKLPIEGLKAIMLGAKADSKKSCDDFNFEYIKAREILQKCINWYSKNNYIND